MYRIIPFKKEHLECMEMREHESRMMDVSVMEYFESGEGYTGLVDGVIVACFGVVVTSDGRGEVWQVPSKFVEKYARTYCRYTKNWLMGVQADYGLRRMETISLDDALHNRWMKYLGFEKEGVKRKLFFDKDYAMWGRIWEQN